MNHDTINLQRLTARLEVTLADLRADTSEDGYWQINKTISNARYGQELLKKVQGSSYGSASSSTIKRGSLPDLQQRLDRVSSDLDAMLATRTSPLAHIERPTYSLPLPPKPIPQEALPQDLIPAEEEVIPIDARPPTVPKDVPTSTTDISSLLSHHREVQDSLTEDLASMARQLKLNTLHFSSSLEKDKELLETADGNLGGNYDVMQKERGRLGAYSKKGGWTTCYVIMSVGAVAAAWMFMFFLIRLT